MKKNHKSSDIKMADIAKAAGVSLATVGRVLHKNGYVSKENREKIEGLIQEYGYVPNKIAQGLKNNKSKLIGHLVIFSPNMLFAKISLAVNKAALERGFHVITMSGHRDLNEEEAQINELIGYRVGGVIVTSNVHIPNTLIQKLVDLKIPVVLIERTYEMAHVDCIKIDDLAGSFDAVRHIINEGHERVGFIGMDLFHEVEKLRYQGYCDALNNAGIKQTEKYINFMPEYSVNAGYQATKKLLELDTPPTAIFSTSDLFVCGVLQYLHEKGKRVPQDLSLVGYDDTLSTLLAPPITSVALSLDDIGSQAFKLLLERSADFEAPSRTVKINTVLINRNSVGRINR